MTITIECTPKELADAVLQLQRQPEATITIDSQIVQGSRNTSMPSDG